MCICDLKDRFESKCDDMYVWITSRSVFLFIFICFYYFSWSCAYEMESSLFIRNWKTERMPFNHRQIIINKKIGLQKLGHYQN